MAGAATMWILSDVISLCIFLLQVMFLQQMLFQIERKKFRHGFLGMLPVEPTSSIAIDFSNSFLFSKVNVILRYNIAITFSDLHLHQKLHDGESRTILDNTVILV